MGYWVIKDCFNRELVCTVKWKESKFTGDNSYLQPLGKGCQKWTGSQKKMCAKTRIFHFSHKSLKESLQILDHNIAKNYIHTSFMSKNVGSYTSAVSFTNTAKQCENKIPELVKAWNINTVATISVLYTILPIREGF